jgi:hypothetical protein
MCRKEMTVHKTFLASLDVASFWLSALCAVAQPASSPRLCASSIPYGENAAAGHRARANGISMYYETYGSGSPPLLIHGDGGSIDAMRCQACCSPKRSPRTGAWKVTA